MLKIILHKNESDNILKGYPWVFNNEINHFEGKIENGSIVKVLSAEKVFVGYGFLNTSSKIMVRILSLNENEVIDELFFENKIKQAIKHREDIGLMESCRLVFSESDFLPGLIVDKYGDYLSVSFMSLGFDMRKDMIVKILVDLLHPIGIMERSDVPTRKKEGLEEFKGVIYGCVPEFVLINENGIKLRVDLYNGQKTGYFLDQKMNRDYLKNFVNDKMVLDCFSHTGGFALNASKNGCKEVYACDISQKAVDDINFNASLNGYNNVTGICCDVFDYLRDPENVNKFDVIVLDPPAFTKSKETIKKAYKGYKEINLQAMKMIKAGGYLLTYSCSQHMTLDLFMQMVKEASIDSKRSVQLIDFRMQSIDHPALLQSEEQFYLKCLVLRVL